MFKKLAAVVILLAAMLAVPQVAHATVLDIWVDSTWEGTQTGYVQAEPWCALDWVLINYFIADGGYDLVIHFSAVDKAGTGSAPYTGNSGGGCSGGASSGHVDMLSKCITRGTSPPIPCSHSITFEGSAWRNTTTYPTAPNWIPNTTLYKAFVRDFHGQNSSHVLLSNYTVDGFVLSGNDKLFTVCGDNVTLKNSTLAYPMGSTGTEGPTVLIAPTADGLHEGSADWCPPATNIKILNNKFINYASEAVYVGGGGCRAPDANAYYNGSGATFTVTNNNSGVFTGTVTKTASGTGYTVGQILYVPGFEIGGASNNTNDLYITVSSLGASNSINAFAVSGSAPLNTSMYSPPTYNNCGGFPSHTDIEIAGNQMSQPDGYFGAGENDAVDVKAGIDGLRVHDNYMHDLIYFRSVVILGTPIIDATPNNQIYNNWMDNSNNQDAAISVSNTWGTPRGIYIYNNVISNQSGGGIRTTSGCQTPFVVANNTIYNSQLYVHGMDMIPGIGLEISCGTPTNNALFGNAITDNGSAGSHNAYDGTYAGCSVSCVSGLTSAAFIAVSDVDFRQPTTSSVLYHAGSDLSSLSLTDLDSDFNSVARASNWDIGAYQYVARPTPGNSAVITTASVTATTLTLNWTTTGTSSDQYLVCQSEDPDIVSPLQCDNSNVIKDYTTNIGTFNVTNLTDATSYYFNVVAKNTSGGNNAYATVNVTTGGTCTPSKVVFAVQPSDTIVGAAVGTVTVAIQNSSSSTCTGSTASVTIANTSMTCSGMTLSGTKTGSASGGLFTTTNLTESAVGSCTLTVTSSGLTDGVSNSFVVSTPGSGHASRFRIRK